MTRLFPAVLLLPFIGFAAHAQQEGPVPTQVLVGVNGKSMPPTDASSITVTVNDRKEPLTSWSPVAPATAQVALLIDDGLRESVGRELDSLRAFVRSLPPGVEVLVGYMQNGRVVAAQPFTTDHAQAASTLHLPEGVPGASASPYFCLSDFVKHWPGSGSSAPSVAQMGASSNAKARFVMMLTNGVDPYNGSTSILNQGSPYVDDAIADAQRGGVAVSAIYFGDAGFRSGSANNSGQSYLAQLAGGTGGVSYWEGIGNPPSTAPFLAQFQHALAETYIATFLAPTGKNPQRDLVRVKFSAPAAKLHAPEMVLPGNQE
jgi:hypothetical protein